jgi:hypothetical protein
MPECRVCGLVKKPRGRDAGANGNAYCDTDCAGYDGLPQAGHLWPGEPCEEPIFGERTCAVCLQAERERPEHGPDEAEKEET